MKMIIIGIVSHALLNLFAEHDIEVISAEDASIHDGNVVLEDTAQHFQDMYNEVRECQMSYIMTPVISHAFHYVNRFTKHRTVDKRALLRTRLHKYI